MLKKLTLKHYAIGLLIFLALYLLFTYFGENLFYAGAMQSSVMRRISLILAALAGVGVVICLITAVVLFVRKMMQAQR